MYARIVQYRPPPAGAVPFKGDTRVNYFPTSVHRRHLVRVLLIAVAVGACIGAVAAVML